MLFRTRRPRGGRRRESVFGLLLLTLAPGATAQGTLDDVYHVLRRTTFGPMASQAKGLEEMPDTEQALIEFIEAQLDPDSLEAEPQILTSLLADIRPQGTFWTLDAAKREVVAKALYSNRQLEAVMAHFWSRHFNTYYDAVLGNLPRLAERWNIAYPDIPSLADQVAFLIRQEAEMFRSNALGTFEDLLRGSATSPAMLLYLDSAGNIVTPLEGRANENYARELLELHTLGLGSNGLPDHYQQDDILALAEVFSGWSVDLPEGEPWTFLFREDAHRDNFTPELFLMSEEKYTGLPSTTLEGQGFGVLEHLAGKRETAEFICSKLYKFFIAEDIPSISVAYSGAVDAWMNPPSGPVGNITEVLRALLLSDEFLDPNYLDGGIRWNLGRIPLEGLTASVRLFEGVAQTSADLDELMTDMEAPLGQRLFQFPAPNGFQGSLLRVLSTTQLLGRTNWNQRLYANHLQPPDLLNYIEYDALALLLGQTDSFEYPDVAIALMNMVAQSMWLEDEQSLVEEFLATESPGSQYDESLQDLWNAGNEDDLRTRLSEALSYVASLSQNILK